MWQKTRKRWVIVFVQRDPRPFGVLNWDDRAHFEPIVVDCCENVVGLMPNKIIARFILDVGNPKPQGLDCGDLVARLH